LHIVYCSKPQIFLPFANCPLPTANCHLLLAH
jgi:hypothetical protein